LIKTAHTKDENGTDIQEVITCLEGISRRIVFFRRHCRLQGIKTFREGKTNISELFYFDQARWDEVSKSEIGATV